MMSSVSLIPFIGKDLLQIGGGFQLMGIVLVHQRFHGILTAPGICPLRTQIFISPRKTSGGPGVDKFYAVFTDRIFNVVERRPDAEIIEIVIALPVYMSDIPAPFSVRPCNPASRRRRIRILLWPIRSSR